jgi:hypothetical protein
MHWPILYNPQLTMNLKKKKKKGEWLSSHVVMSALPLNIKLVKFFFF